MKPILVSFDGHNINDTTNFVARIPYGTPLQATQASVNFIDRAGATPVYAGKELKESYLTISITCMGTVGEQLETINQWFNIYDEEPKQLIIKDTDDGDKQYSIYCTPRNISALIGGPTAKYNEVKISLARKEPVWKSVTQTAGTWSITASGGTQNVVNNGNIETYPVFEFTPTSYPGGGYGYNRKVLFYQTSNYAFPNRPVEIFGGLNTSTLVGAGKMLANGDDCRVLVDGIEVNRWFGDSSTAVINSTATKCWIVLDVPPNRNTTLKTGIANTGTPTYIELDYTTANKNNLLRMPNTGRVLINSEEFTYSARVITTTDLKLTVSARSDRGTTAGTHAIGATVRWVPVDIQIVYGNASATAPEIDDTKKPIINLATSTNSSFVYANFYDTTEPGGQRAGAWKPSVLAVSNALLSESKTYYGTNAGADTDPAEVMGMYASSYPANGVYRADSVQISWLFDVPDAVSMVSASGSKYRNATNWFTAVRLQSSVDGITWVNEGTATEPTPGTLSTWQAWSMGSEAIPNTSRKLRYIVIGTTAATLGKYMAFEVSAGTVTLVNYPTTSLGSESGGFYIDATITNSTTSDFFTVKFPLQTNQTLYIDTDPNNPSVKKSGQIINVLNPSTNRSNWLPLDPGTNTLTYTAGTSSNITVVIKHYNRMNFQ